MATSTATAVAAKPTSSDRRAPLGDGVDRTDVDGEYDSMQ